jgi:hypothetical protein
MKRQLLARDEWNIGVVRQSAEDIVRSGIVEPIRWLEPNPWRILADPFCYQRPDGRTVVLAEMLNHWIGRGEIWGAVLPLDGNLRVEDFAPYADCHVHLSYPFRVQDETGCFFAAESWEGGGLHLWRDDGTYVKCIVDRPVIDPTFFHASGYWWLFCTLADDQPNERLHIYYSTELTGVWYPHRSNPVKVDASSARPAGKIIMVDGEAIRPAQNCSETYGGGLVFNRIIALTPDCFHELPISTLSPERPYVHGLHTIAAAGEFTIIDGKRWHDELLPNMVRKIVAKGCKIQRLARKAPMNRTMRFQALS